MRNDRLKKNFGCRLYWSSSADAKWEGMCWLKREKPLVDESHFIVVILTCSACEQPFISIFTEEIDWVNGDDPQYWTLIPFTRQEAMDLTHRDSTLFDKAKLNSLAPGRRSLRLDYFKEADKPKLYWATGIVICAHY
jgi:hypothetical protein